MSKKKYEWQCIGHNPTEWALGFNAGGELTAIQARTVRLKSGQWQWSVYRPHLKFGTEASCELAMVAAERALPVEPTPARGETSK